MLDPTATALIALVCSRRPLLEKLRLTTPLGIPLLAEITKHLAAYLTAERGLGRIELTTDVDALAVMLVGSAHLTVLDVYPNTPAAGSAVRMSLVDTAVQPTLH
jgi:hypothetical protein